LELASLSHEIGFVFYPGEAADGAELSLNFLFQRTYAKLFILTLALFFQKRD